MSSIAISAVLDMIEELTHDEFRLLLIVAEVSASAEEWLYPRWETVFDKTGFTLSQCRRILLGLKSEEIVRFASFDPACWLDLSDPRLPLPLKDGLFVWIQGMPWTSKEGAQRPPYRKRIIPSSLRDEVFERDNYTCRHCGSTDHLTADHIYPESKGGETTLDNLQTLCRSCNSRKGTRIAAS